jgi:tetratricopeptide (TPR) repeat protein
MLDLVYLIGLRRSGRRPHRGQLNLTSLTGDSRPTARRPRKRPRKGPRDLSFLRVLRPSYWLRRRGRKLRPVFLSGLLAVVAVLGVAVHLVHGFQVRRTASALLDHARRAEADKDPARVAESLKRYLNINREDGPTWAWYARVVGDQVPSGPGREQVYLVCEQALRYRPGDTQLERRCADLALDLKRYNDARRHLKLLYERAPKDSRGNPTDPELENLLGQCDRGESKFTDAERWFRTAVAHDPGEVASYDNLARMFRVELKQAETADQLVEAMVEANPRSARAYLRRWRYHSDFHTAADPHDLQRALQLDPEDSTVLLAAAGSGERKGDLAAAREYLQKGLALAPENTTFSLKLAEVELRDGNPDRAERVLRVAVEANPQSDLMYLLAEALILQGKIDGADEAGAYLTRLRKMGLREGFLEKLEARILMQRQQWSAAIAKINTARALLAADSSTMAQLNLMLAACYDRLGLDDQRLAALQQAAGDERTAPEAAPALAENLARSGKLDEALKIHLQLVDRRPESRLDLVRLSIQKVLRQPSEQRNWQDVEQKLQQAERAVPRRTEELTLLRVDLLTAQGRPEDARNLVEAARTREPKNVSYRVKLAKIARDQGNAGLDLKILDQAEKDLGPNLELRRARLDAWVSRGGPEANAAIAQLAKTRTQLPPADQPAFLESMARGAYRLDDLPLARDCLRELMVLQPDNLQVMIGLFDLALKADDQTEAAELVGKIRRVEGEEGPVWRYAQAVCLINQLRRGDRAGLGTAQTLVSEILAKRGDWWGGPLLRGELAELRGDLDAAIPDFIRSVELGNSKPETASHLLDLLNQRQDFDQIDRLAQMLQDRSVVVEDLTFIAAMNAIRKRDFARGIAMARQAFPESSTRATDHLLLGRILLAAGRREDGEKALKRAVELGPGLPDVWLVHVRYLVESKQIDAAKAAIAAAQKALPVDRSALTLAQCFTLTGDITQAEALYGKALAEKPNDPATLRLAADFYVEQNRHDQALPLLARLVVPKTGALAADVAWAKRTGGLIGLGPGGRAGIDQALGLIEQNLKANPHDYDDRHLSAILMAVRTSRRPEAIRQLEALDALNRLGREERFLLAYLYRAEGNPDRYRAQMLQVLAGAEKDSRFLANFIGFLIGRNELDQASHWLAELKRQQPASLGTLEMEALVLKASKRDQDALALLQTRARQSPDELGAVARLLEQFGFSQQAEEAYKADIARVPKEPERALALAQFLARQNRPGEAIDVLKQAWTNCPPDRVALTALAAYDAPSADQTQKSQIEAWVVEAIQQRPKAAGLVPKLAAIRLRQRRLDEAQALFRQALAIDPDHPQALNDLAWVLSQSESSPSATAEALELINRAIDIAGPTANRLDTRAVILLQSGQIERALQDLGRALVLMPSSHGIHFHLARAKLLAKDKAESRKAFQRAVELGLKLETVDPLERATYLKMREELGLR